MEEGDEEDEDVGEEDESDGVELGMEGGRAILFKGRMTGAFITASAYARREATTSTLLGKRLVSVREDRGAQRSSTGVQQGRCRDSLNTANYGSAHSVASDEV